MKDLPRFRGNAIEHEGGWVYEIYVSFLGSGDGAESFRSHDTFKTREIAIEKLLAEVQFMIEGLAKKMPEIDAKEYIDMKTNERMRWDKTQYN